MKSPRNRKTDPAYITLNRKRRFRGGMDFLLQTLRSTFGKFGGGLLKYPTGPACGLTGMS
jgi:hypothetical protein